MKSVFSILLLLGLGQAQAAQYTCYNQTGRASHQLDLDPSKGTGKIITSTQMSSYQDTNNTFPFSIGQVASMGQSTVCVKWSCQGLCIPILMEVYETGRDACSKTADSKHKGVVTATSNPYEYTLKVHVDISEDKTFGGKQVTGTDYTESCLHSDAVSLYSQYSFLALSSQGHVLFLEKDYSMNAKTNSVLTTKLNAFDYSTETAASTTILDLMKSAEAGQVKLFKVADVTQDFDISKISEATCWLGKSKYKLVNDGAKVKVMSAEQSSAEAKALIDGNIVNDGGKTKVSMGERLFSPRALTGQTFLLSQYICIGR